MRKIFIIIISFIFASIPAISADTNWKHVAPNNYVDEDAIVGLEDRYGYSFLLKSFNKGQYEPVNGRQILYTLGQYEIDCRKKTYKIGVLDSYDENDVFVFGDYNRYAEFQPIVNGTAVSAIAQKLCRAN